MATIFSSQAGRVIAVLGEAMPFTMMIDDWEGYYAFKSIITSITFNGSGGFQVQHSLFDMIYLYVFNERMGQMQVGGLAFASICENDDGKSGIEYVQQYYDCHRLTKRKTPVTVTLGSSLSLRAFLVGVNHSISDASTQLDQFQLSLIWVPRRVSCKSDTIETDEEVETLGEPTEETTPERIPAPEEFNPQGQLTPEPIPPPVEYNGYQTGGANSAATANDVAIATNAPPTYDENGNQVTDTAPDGSVYRPDNANALPQAGGV